MSAIRRTLTLSLILLHLVSPTLFPKQCSSPAGTMEGKIDIQVKGEEGGSRRRTVISSNIGLKETLCFFVEYNVTNPAGGVNKKKVLYTLDYDRLVHVYNYKNSYKFAIPATDMKCWCDCPGGTNKCDSNTDSCGRYNGNEHTCVNWYADGQSRSGCALQFTGVGQTCCKLEIVRLNSLTYRAVEVASPITQARLRLNVIETRSDGSNVPLITDRKYNIDLDSATMADDLNDLDYQGNLNFSVILSISTSSMASVLPAGWYYGELGKSDVKTNVKINGLNEWSMNKLGWFKIDQGIEKIRKSAVRDSFTATTENCGEDRLNTHFEAMYYNQKPYDAVDAYKFYLHKVDYVVRNDSSRQVLAYHHSSPRLEIKLSFSEQSIVTFLIDPSELRDFVGTIMLDKYSNRYANLTLIEGSGSITGTIHANGKTGDNFYVYVPDSVKKFYNKFVRLSSTCEKGTGSLQGKLVAMVCLKPLGENKEKICKQVICYEERNEDFELPQDSINYEVAEFDDLLNLSTWKKYLNPLQWFKGGSPSTVEWVIIAVTILLVVFIVGILVKLARMFNCIFKCLTCCGSFKKKSRDTYDMVRVRAGSMGKYRRQASERVKSVIPIRRADSGAGGGASAPAAPAPDSFGEDLHYIVVNDHERNIEADRQVRFDNLVSSKKWAF